MPKKLPQVLIIEDNVDVADLYKRMLEPKYSVLLVDSVKSFFEYYEAAGFKRPDLIISDNNLDDGILFDAIEEKYGAEFMLFKEVPTFAVSGHGRDELIDAAYTLGIREFIDKPVREETLLAKLNWHLKRITPYEVDSVACTITVGKKKARLTQKEMELFVAINDGREHTNSKDTLCRRVFGLTDLESKRKMTGARNNLSVHLTSIRKKLEPLGVSVENTPNSRESMDLRVTMLKRTS